MKTSTSSITTFILICYLFLPSLHANCPDRCEKGKNVRGCKCKKECAGYVYQYLRQGVLKCEECTNKCTGNHIEVTSCTFEHNRVCHCRAGFFCENGNNLSTYCQNGCDPCPTGTFSSMPSLNQSCRPHTDCAKLGKKMLKEGTATQDRKCGDPETTTPIPTKSIIPAKAIMPTKTITQTKAIIYMLYSSTEVTQTRRMYSQSTDKTTYATSVKTGDSQLLDQAQDGMSKDNLLLLILLIILMLVVAVFCMLRKSTAHKTLSKWTDFISGKHNLTEKSRIVEGDAPLDSDVRCQSTGMMSHSGSGQQVNMEHNVKGENVNNTVGTIVIISPGTVILGSNSSDKKEDAEVCEEDIPLICTPQQESTLPQVRIKVSAQEEKELSFPVPATGK